MNPITKTEPYDMSKPWLPGKYLGVPADIYHAIPAVSSSVLKRLYMSSPKHVKECPFESTAAMDLGTAFHSMVLDSDFYAKHFVLPEKRLKWTTAEGKVEQAQHAAIIAMNAGKTELTAYAVRCMEAAYHEFRSHPFGGEIAGRIASKKTETEVTLIWQEEGDADDGIEPFLCKARLDMYDIEVIRDLKTTRNANPKAFMWDILPTRSGLNYWLQAGWYYRGAKAIGLNVLGVEFIAIELDGGRGITFHGLDDTELDSMQEQVGNIARQWARCLQTGVYSNYPAIRHMLTIGEE